MLLEAFIEGMQVCKPRSEVDKIEAFVEGIIQGKNYMLSKCAVTLTILSAGSTPRCSMRSAFL